MSSVPKQLIAIFVTYKRKKDKPVELVAVTSGGFLQALMLEKECATKLKIPQSWTHFEVYKLQRKEKELK